jgi:hypothetical protein
MPRWPLSALAPLLLVAGCVEDHRTQFVRPGPSTVPAPRASTRSASRAPATEAAGRRVVATGRKLLDANPQLGMRPVFLTVGAPHPEVFHQGGRLEPYQVIVSEGLVNRCKGDDQLAAVLAHQLGRMVAEREAAAGRPTRANDRPPPPERIGNDHDSTFGGPDGTRRMEAARLERQRTAPKAPPPAPQVLAREYLRRAGYPEAALATVAPLLREAEDHDKIEQHLRPAPREENRPAAVPPGTSTRPATEAP